MHHTITDDGRILPIYQIEEKKTPKKDKLREIRRRVGIKQQRKAQPKVLTDEDRAAMSVAARLRKKRPYIKGKKYCPQCHCHLPYSCFRIVKNAYYPHKFIAVYCRECEKERKRFDPKAICPTKKLQTSFKKGKGKREVPPENIRDERPPAME